MLPSLTICFPFYRDTHSSALAYSVEIILVWGEVAVYFELKVQLNRSENARRPLYRPGSPSLRPLDCDE